MRRLYAIDAIRGCAAMVVALHHWLQMTGHYGLGPLPGLAVDAFFVLSGFVMARTYEPRMAEGLGGFAFLRVRWRRLVLPAAVGAVLGLAYAVALGAVSVRLIAAFWAAVFFLPAFWLSVPFWLNGPAWTLFHEIGANAVHGFGIWRLRTSQLLQLAVLSVALWIALVLNGFGFWDHGLFPILSVFPRFFGLYIVGVVIFRQWGDRAFDFRVPAKISAAIGELSYPLYATHVPALFLGGDVLRLDPFPQLLLAAVVAISVATLDARLRHPSSARLEPRSRPTLPQPEPQR